MIEILIQMKQDGDEAMNHLTNVTGPNDDPATKWELAMAERILNAVQKIMEETHEVATATKIVYDNPNSRPILPESL